MGLVFRIFLSPIFLSGLLHFSVSHFSVRLVSVIETTTEAFRARQNRVGVKLLISQVIQSASNNLLPRPASNTRKARGK
jgi:hypothetical protein